MTMKDILLVGLAVGSIWAVRRAKEYVQIAVIVWQHRRYLRGVQ